MPWPSKHYLPPCNPWRGVRGVHQASIATKKCEHARHCHTPTNDLWRALPLQAATHMSGRTRPCGVWLSLSYRYILSDGPPPMRLSRVIRPERSVIQPLLKNSQSLLQPSPCLRPVSWLGTPRPPPRPFRWPLDERRCKTHHHGPDQDERGQIPNTSLHSQQCMVNASPSLHSERDSASLPLPRLLFCPPKYTAASSRIEQGLSAHESPFLFFSGSVCRKSMYDIALHHAPPCCFATLPSSCHCLSPTPTLDPTHAHTEPPPPLVFNLCASTYTL